MTPENRSNPITPPVETIKPENINVERKEILRKPGEIQPEYLHRAGCELVKIIREAKKDKLYTPLRDKNLIEIGTNTIHDILKEARKESSSLSADNTKEIEYIKNHVGGFKHLKVEKPANSADFDQTQRDRKFFDRQYGKGNSQYETYWNTLFFPYNTKETRAFAKEILDNKTIALLGGGRAKIGKELEEYGIKPKNIVNIDPFIEIPEPDADTVVSANAADNKFMEKLEEHNIKKADEIWAEFSVPAYLETPEEIIQLLKNIDSLLAENGNARIWPIVVSGAEGEQTFFNKKEALVRGLDDLNKTKKYKISYYDAAGHTGIIIHKFSNIKA
jgi:hypothetical protein